MTIGSGTEDACITNIGILKYLKIIADIMGKGDLETDAFLKLFKTVDTINIIEIGAGMGYFYKCLRRIREVEDIRCKINYTIIDLDSTLYPCYLHHKRTYNDIELNIVDDDESPYDSINNDVPKDTINFVSNKNSRLKMITGGIHLVLNSESLLEMNKEECSKYVEMINSIKPKVVYMRNRTIRISENIHRNFNTELTFNCDKEKTNEETVNGYSDLRRSMDLDL